MRGYYFINTELSNKRAHTIQILNTIQGMVRAGHALKIVTPRYGIRDKDINNVLKYYGVEEKLDVIFLPNFGFKNASILAFILFNITTSLYFVIQVMRRKVDYIYFRSEFFFPLSLFSQIFRVPYFYEIHREGKTKNMQWLKLHLIRHARGCITLTEELKNRFERIHTPILSVHDGVRTASFDVTDSVPELRNFFGINKEVKVVLYVGTISKNKGSDIIFDVARYLPHIDFYLVGPRKMHIPEYLMSNVHVLEPVSFNMVPKLQKTADVLLITNPKNVYSQSPMKLFEYLATGLPIISSDLENIREILSDEHALFYKPEDTKDLANKIQKAFDQLETLKEKAKIHNPILAQHYSWDARGKSIVVFIEKNL